MQTMIYKSSRKIYVLELAIKVVFAGLRILANIINCNKASIHLQSQLIVLTEKHKN